MTDSLPKIRSAAKQKGRAQRVCVGGQARTSADFGVLCTQRSAAQRSAAQVEATRLTAAAQKKLPRYPIPCFRLGRLSCSLGARGTGLGGMLLGLATQRCLRAREQVAAYALLVDAKDTQGADFYKHYGFMPLHGMPLALYLPLG